MESRYLAALSGRNEGAPPLWIMRQAGRYLPEYRELRKKHRFETMMETPELAYQVTKMPLERFDLDAAILFSDILPVCRTVGGKVAFVEGKGPVVDFNFEKFAVECGVESLQFVEKAIRLLKPDLSVPLIGFAGGPFTVASYLIEGGGVGDLKKVKRAIAERREELHRLLSLLTDQTIDYLLMQVEAGVDAIQLFDTWAGMLDPCAFQEFVLPYNQKIFAALSGKVPTIFFGRGLGSHLHLLKEIGATGIGVDQTVDLSYARAFLGNEVVLQGNLDPGFLYGSKDSVVEQVKKVLEKMKGDPAYIFNFGYGILPDVRPEVVEWIVETVKQKVTV